MPIPGNFTERVSVRDKCQQFFEKELKMKSLQTSLFFAAMLGLLALCGSAWAFSGSGSGTEADPYVITDVYQLQEMQNDLAAYYVLGNDIDASGTVSWNGSAGFEPVGNDIDYFTGSFDGLGHTITGLYINRPTERRVGLFGLLKNGGQVMNVGLIAARTYGKYYVGTLAGTSSNQSHIHDCYATGEVTISADGSSDAKSGGLVGNQGYSTISKCYSAVNVTALSSRYQIGGLCGYSELGPVIHRHLLKTAIQPARSPATVGKSVVCLVMQMVKIQLFPNVIQSDVSTALTKRV